MFNKLIVIPSATLLIGTSSLLCAAARADTPPEQVVALVQTAAQEQLARDADSNGWVEPKFEVSVLRSSRPLAACAQAIKVAAVDTRLPGRMRFAAVCPGAAGWRYEFVVRAQVTAQVVVAALDIPAGKTLAADDVLLERHDISGIPDSLGDLQAAIGLSGRRTLRSGEVVRQAVLAQPDLVKRGQAVSIVARRDQVEVSMAGQALENGARDSTIRVRNANGVVIRARVKGAGLVEPAEIPASTQSPD